MSFARCVVALTSTALVLCVTTANDASLATRWRALPFVTPTPITTSYSGISVATASALFEDPTQKAQWLHDIGAWHLLDSGNMTRAEEFLRASADMGHATAQFLVGALVATSESPSPAEAALYYHFAARGESIEAAMALGYRHFVGYDAPRACETALRYYKTVADDVMRHRHALPNRALPIQVYTPSPPARLSDDQSRRPQTDDHERARVEYLRQRAAVSTSVELLVRTASLLLFSGLYQESSSAHTDAHHEAATLLGRAATLGSSSAKALLGHVYAYGLVNATIDVPHAIQLYEDAFNASNASRNGRSEAANGLGMLYLDGVDSQSRDVERAMSYFQIAARAGHAEGVFNAASVMARVEPRRSIQYLEASADVGHVGAIFQLARVREKQRFRGADDVEHQCHTIVATYKRVAEHHAFGRSLLKAASKAYLDGRFDHARRLYEIGAELGYEVAEHNTMWLYERYVFASLKEAIGHTAYRKLVRRGVAQHSVDAVVRTGDLAFTTGDYRLAMKQYRRAIEMKPTHAKALYSVGYLLEWGLGTVEKGPNLVRAREYYVEAQRHEPLMGYALPVLILRVDAALCIQRLADLATQAIKAMAEWFAPVVKPEIEKEGRIVFSETTPKPSAYGAPVHLVSAMAFNGVDSTLTIETSRPSSLKGLTLATWLWIEKPANDVSTTQVLMELPNALRIDLAPHSDGVSWQLRVLGSEGFQSVLTLTKCALRARQWHHVVVRIDPTKDKTELVVDDHIADSGNLLSSFSSLSSRPAIHIGHRMTHRQEVTGTFHGRLHQFRVWSAAREDGDLDHNGLWFDLEMDVRARADERDRQQQNHVVDKRRDVYASQVTVRDVGLRIVRFPLDRH